jgi:hypothetical protein
MCRRRRRRRRRRPADGGERKRVGGRNAVGGGGTAHRVMTMVGAVGKEQKRPSERAREGSGGGWGEGERNGGASGGELDDGKERSLTRAAGCRLLECYVARAARALASPRLFRVCS